MTMRNVYLKPNVLVEPLFNQWYASVPCDPAVSYDIEVYTHPSFLLASPSREELRLKTH